MKCGGYFKVQVIYKVWETTCDDKFLKIEKDIFSVGSLGIYSDERLVGNGVLAYKIAWISVLLHYIYCPLLDDSLRRGTLVFA